MLVKAIIEALKKGSIKNIVLFSNDMAVPPLPHVVVKPETGVIEGTRTYRIIARHSKGRFQELENYVLTELDRLLCGTITDVEGSRYKLYPNGYTDITADQEGDTYFMERIYYTPLTARR